MGEFVLVPTYVRTYYIMCTYSHSVRLVRLKQQPAVFVALLTEANRVLQDSLIGENCVRVSPYKNLDVKIVATSPPKRNCMYKCVPRYDDYRRFI